jgi:hypothetical protein
MRLRHADRAGVEAQAGVAFDLFFGFGRVVHAVGAVDFAAMVFDLALDAFSSGYRNWNLLGFSAALTTASASFFAPLPPSAQ